MTNYLVSNIKPYTSTTYSELRSSPLRTLCIFLAGSGRSGQLRGLSNSVTTFMRQYYENVGSKKQPRLRNQQSTSSNELEDRDSGFQVIVMSLCPFMSSWCLYVCPSSLLHCALRPLSFICLCVACVSNRLCLSVCLSVCLCSLYHPRMECWSLGTRLT